MVKRNWFLPPPGSPQPFSPSPVEGGARGSFGCIAALPVPAPACRNLKGKLRYSYLLSQPLYAILCLCYVELEG